MSATDFRRELFELSAKYGQSINDAEHCDAIEALYIEARKLALDPYRGEASPELVGALSALVDEFGGSLDNYHKLGPDFTFKDGTEVIHASTLVDREPQIEAALAALAQARGEQP